MIVRVAPGFRERDGLSSFLLLNRYRERLPPSLGGQGHAAAS